VKTWIVTVQWRGPKRGRRGSLWVIKAPNELAAREIVKIHEQDAEEYSVKEASLVECLRRW